MARSLERPDDGAEVLLRIQEEEFRKSLNVSDRLPVSSPSTRSVMSRMPAPGTAPSSYAPSVPESGSRGEQMTRRARAARDG